MKHKKIYICILIIFSLSLCTIQLAPKEEILKIKKQNFQEKIIISGVVKSPEVINISSEVSGKIIEILKSEGDLVKKGEPLVKIDNNQINLKLLQEEENLKSALSQLNKIQTTDLDIAKSYFETANLNFKIGESEYLKFKQLFEKNLVTELEFNSKKLRYLSDKNSYIESKKRLESISQGDDKKSLLIKIENIKFSIESLHKELEKYNILSPIDGIITEKNIEVGETILQYEVMLEISSGDKKILEIELDEKQISKINLNQKIESFFSNNLDLKSLGEIFYIAPYVNKNNGTIKIKGTLDNPPPQFLYNMNINGVIYGKEYRDIIVIPEDFLYLKNNMAFVYVKNHRKIELKEVKIALNFSEKVIIIDGLNDNDEIVFPTDKINQNSGFTHYE
ncbi:MAG: efflux RND transporter periplasmic adaptor subunit [Fusobacteriaceae bacterium]